MVGSISQLIKSNSCNWPLARYLARCLNPNLQLTTGGIGSVNLLPSPHRFSMPSGWSGKKSGGILITNSHHFHPQKPVNHVDFRLCFYLFFFLFILFARTRTHTVLIEKYFKCIKNWGLINWKPDSNLLFFILFLCFSVTRKFARLSWPPVMSVRWPLFRWWARNNYFYL